MNASLLAAAALSEDTPLTMALAVGLMTGAFYAGQAFASIRARLTGVEQRVDHGDAIMAEVVEIVKDHERRLGKAGG